MRHKGFFLQPSFLIGTAQEKLNNPSGQTVQENYLNPIPSKINTLNEEIKKLEEFIQGINLTLLRVSLGEIYIKL